MATDPIVALTKPLADGSENPEQMTNLLTKEQAWLWAAWGFAASKQGYKLEFLADITTDDKMMMMAAPPTKRSDQIVEALKALQAPLGIDVGMQGDSQNERVGIRRRLRR